MFWLLFLLLTHSFSLTSLSHALYTLTSSHSPAGIDYEAVTTILTFNVSIPTQMVTIPILDDLIVENYKSFDVTLTTFDTAAELRLQNASVTIRDNDGKFQLYALPVFYIELLKFYYLIATL